MAKINEFDPAPLRLALFDFDGTLCDSAEHIVTNIKQSCLDIGLPEIDDIVARNSIGQGFDHMALSLCGGDPLRAEELFSAYRSRFKQAMLKGSLDISPLFVGARKAIAALVADGWLTGIVTNKGRNGLDHLLQVHKMNDLFDVTYTVTETPAKPAPDMALDAMRRCGVEAENTVLIGDTIYDAGCASNAGVAFVGVSWGYNEVADLRKSGACKILTSFDNLSDNLKSAITPNL